MSQKVVLVTGGSSGIGKSIGTFLVSKGYIVYGTTRNKAKYPDFNAFQLLEMDVRKVETIQYVVDEIISREGKLDVLINNAGVGITGPIEETPHAEILGAFDTNFHGPLHVAKKVLPQMRKQGGGYIINITSIAGYMGLPFRGIYSATKGALELATEAIRMEVKDFGIKVCSLAPGDFATNIASGRYHAPVHEQSDYKKYGESVAMMNTHVDAGQDPILVAKTILNILNTTNPKVHYRVGAFMQKFSLFLKSVLSDKLYEKLLMNHYKL
ncbi:SDR family oxidoreductase [Aurantibacter crassamenti]|uniref:SDR family oxidoreductase n=1 Tax=Aurantibacter crassamenti TaxID=1837375 RepID=UPI00193981D4|nr:SDR family oxidoreductase [Aurantibacter crassamenti]MBM1107447.1 SDR family oxidoreductase [Aurantibacter crassamenti]